MTVSLGEANCGEREGNAVCSPKGKRRKEGVLERNTRN